MYQKNDKQLKLYFKEIKRNLNTLYDSKQANAIMFSIKQSASTYFTENPSATFDDFKNHFGKPEDIISCYLDETLIPKIDVNLQKKRIFQLVAVFICILFLLFALLCFKSYLDVQDSIIHYNEVIIY